MSQSASASSPGSWLSKESTVAGPGFNRWMVPPAALCVHLCIGQVYAFSVFNEPLSTLIGGNEQAADDWSIASIGWIFSIAILFLGLAAAFGGSWVERVGPRKTMVAAAALFGGGFIVSSLGVMWHQLWLIYLGYGVLGGSGIGLGYISPVKTLMTWFPDRPGMATGMAIMGFGGGAFIASPLSLFLIEQFGVSGAFLTLGIIYIAYMLVGATIVRVPADDWLPEGYTEPEESKGMVTTANVHVNEALKTRQFWLIWGVLFLNVTAGIGVLSQASLMSQEMFPDTITAAAAAGFVGLLSLFNMGGRFFWASMSDYIGRNLTYAIFFALGIALYIFIPTTENLGSILLFVVAYGIIISMYGGGFATLPAYLKDVFGKEHVGAIHGRTLTAWSAAGIVGPSLVNYIREYQIDSGVAPADAYTVTMYIMAGLLAVGFVLNFLMSPVKEKHHIESRSEPAAA